MKGRVYFVVNEGELVYASKNEDKANGFCVRETNKSMFETAFEFGRDLDDLTDDEYNEVAFASGFEGGFYYVDYVDVPKDYNEDDEFETCESDVFTYSTLYSALRR